MKGKKGFQPGVSGNISGKPKGTPNRLTKTVKETILAAFNKLQSDPKANMLEWAKKHPKDFYLIAAKLIPTEISGIDGKDIYPKGGAQAEEIYLNRVHYISKV